jgi:hypothetical protein
VKKKPFNKSCTVSWSSSIVFDFCRHQKNLAQFHVKVLTCNILAAAN